MDTSSSLSRNIGQILTILFVVFIVLKLIGTIDWSWWWVLAPSWLPTLLLIVVSLIKVLMRRRP